MRKNIFFLTLSIICNNWLYASHDNSYVTNPSQTDGFGSQFQMIIAAVVYAELTNKQYVYTPFSTMEHNYDNNADFIAQKEWLINFIGNFEINRPAYDLCDPINYKLFFDTNIERCAQSDALCTIKTIFRANKNTHNYFGTDAMHIAIHVRRPNQDDNRIAGADTPDTLFLAMIDVLRHIYHERNPVFHLYSQGDRENFNCYNAPDVQFHLNESVEDTFIGMVLADVLVAGASSFSYTAALLSDGIVYYIPFWHQPLPHWISVNKLLKDDKKSYG